MMVDRHALAAAPVAPVEEDGRAFAEPWQARAFAITIALHKAGLFTWKDWTTALGAEVCKASAGDTNRGEIYYRQWLAALETLVAAKGIADPTVLDLYREAWRSASERTPHGSPIELEARDFKG
jgi:nitrile hydratase accessory protein